MKTLTVEKGMANSQIILTGGRPKGKKGFYTIIKYGLKVKECLAINFACPVGIWCLKKSISDKFHSYIVFTFPTRKTVTYFF